MKCKYCDSDFESRLKKTIKCKKEECKNAHARFLYEKLKIEKKCSNCDLDFIGKRKEKLCNNCKEYASDLRRSGLKQIEQKTVCRRCSELIETKIVFITSTTIKKKSDNLCNSCKLDSSKERAEKMLGDKNPNFQGVVNKKRKYRRLLIEKKRYKKVSKERKEEIREWRSNLMKKINPMHQKHNVEKVINTINEKIKNGEIKYKTGCEHHSWKGNRPLDKIIRTRLKFWRKSNLKSSNYTCNKCNKIGGKLEIHHTTPFRNVITKCSPNKPLNEYVVDTEEFEELIKLIIEFHKNNNIGVVLCEKCHSEEDEYRKI